MQRKKLSSTERVGIVVGGGPAPGINGVISSAALAAMDLGHEVIGFFEGFEFICKEALDLSKEDKVKLLRHSDVTHIHWEGGSVLRTARTEPKPEEIEMIIKNLYALNVRYLITIGGDDTATTASRLAEKCVGKVNVVHVPKTIDNDLPLPGTTPTFGFQTARDFGATVVTSLLYDAKTTSRWFIVIAMGRKAGHLALGIGKSAGATITIIPEEFKEGAELELRDIAEIIVGAMIKRRSSPMNRPDGLAVVAEGVAFKLKESEIKRLEEEKLGKIKKDEAGRIRLADVQLGRAIELEIRRILDDKYRFNGGPPLTKGIVVKDVGYELRCVRPIRFDIDYTRDLGYGAVIAALKGWTNCMVSCPPISDREACTSADDVQTIPLSKLRGADGRVIVRMVNIGSLSYRVAREYMIRLEEEDFTDAEVLASLARVANMTPEQFTERFKRLRQLQAYHVKRFS